jgi:hypothetical protein
MVPFRTGRADCPYVIGDHASVAETIAGLVKEGRTTLILDIPPTALDFENLRIVLDRVAGLIGIGEGKGEGPDIPTPSVLSPASESNDCTPRRGVTAPIYC